MSSRWHSAGRWPTGPAASFRRPVQGVNLRVVVVVGPPDVEPGQQPGGKYHDGAQENPEGEARNHSYRQKGTPVGSQSDEAEVQQHHRPGEPQDDTPPRPIEPLQGGAGWAGHHRDYLAVAVADVAIHLQCDLATSRPGDKKLR